MNTTAMSAHVVPARGPCQGVAQILVFNWRIYAGTAAAVCVALAACPLAGAWVRAATLAFVAPAVFWAIASIAVSYYVYDRSALYDFNWMREGLAATPKRWINIHAGLDETSGLFKELFAGTEGRTVDIFDARTMTEPSIKQARQLRAAGCEAIAARYDALPFADARFNAAFLIFAAHELRRHELRVRLFREVARVLDAGGELVLMEHMRGGWNFAAFGPGALHFFSRRAWLMAAHEAGFAVESEFSRTPFVRVFVLRRARWEC
jgi:SAM-dependent methyltransferase